MIEESIFWVFNSILKWTIVWIAIGMFLEIIFRRIDSISIKLYFKWFDFWLGWFYDQKSQSFYYGFFPMLGIKIHKHRWVSNQGALLDIYCYWCEEKRQGVIVW